MTPYLSKSLLNNYRQCPRRLWLEMQDRAARKQGLPPLAQAVYSAETLRRFVDGHVIGRIAKACWPDGIDIEAQSWVQDEKTGERRRDLSYAQRLTQMSLAHRKPLFETTFSHRNLLIMADVMRPLGPRQGDGWQMIEVKSSTEPKDYHLTDLATQAWAAEQCGVSITRVALLLVNKGFELQTEGDYTQLLGLHDDPELQAQVREAQAQMPATLRGAAQTLALRHEPLQHQPGEHCTTPFECPYQAHCTGNPTQNSQASPADPTAPVPIRLYNDRGQARARQLLQADHTDLRQVPAQTIAQVWNGHNETHQINRRLAQAVRNGQPVIDAPGVRQALATYTWPVQHLDFETISFTAPVWPGTRSGEQIPFQYSVHFQVANGLVQAHGEFLDTSGQDPRRALAEKLVQDLRPDSTILAWNASFERQVIQSLAEQFADLAPALMRLHAQIKDLLPVVRLHYAHPAMVHRPGGMFSIKTVLPLLMPRLNHNQLEGVQNGTEAQLAYLRVAAPEAVRREEGYTEAQREREIRNLLLYCKMDTAAMVSILFVF
ncbi:MAG: hypothetical protein CFE38_14770 [Comamonadaceae bacterium PBBC1]|nr:MAG: hypothetical protein CFE38_14770 [Comamonadaceae bacterium PBBC1]